MDVEPSLKIQILSDTHLEWFPGVAVADLPDPLNDIPAHAPYMALLGDIGNPFEPLYKEFIQDLSQKFEHVFVVAGNHEYYHNMIETANEQITKVASEFKNVTFLQRTSVEIKGITFLGATLWTLIPTEPQDTYNAYWLRINDYRMIKVNDAEEGQILLEPRHQNAIHLGDKAWLTSALEETQKQNKKVVVFSHHSPIETHIQNVDMRPGGKNNELRFLDFSDQTNLLSKFQHIKVWGFGHTHYSSSQVFCQTRIVSNCLGYIKREHSDPNFRVDFVIETDQPLDDPIFESRGHYVIEPPQAVDADEQEETQPQEEGEWCQLM